MKQNAVQSLINKGLKGNVVVGKTIGMGIPYNYRNKAIYPVGKNKKGDIVIGTYAKRSHEIIEIDECMIQQEITEKIAKDIINFWKDNNLTVYDEKSGRGALRHILIKVRILYR